MSRPAVRGEDVALQRQDPRRRREVALDGAARDDDDVGPRDACVDDSVSIIAPLDVDELVVRQAPQARRALPHQQLAPDDGLDGGEGRIHRARRDLHERPAHEEVPVPFGDFEGALAARDRRQRVLEHGRRLVAVEGRLVVREAGDGAAKGDAALAAVADRVARRAVERDGVAPLCWFVAAFFVAGVALFHPVHHLLEGLVLGVLAVGRVRVRHRWSVVLLVVRGCPSARGADEWQLYRA